jgi:hypothetical protein
MAVLKALLMATTAYLRVLPLVHLRKLYSDLDFYDDEILDLASSGDADDELRMEALVKRRGRCREYISTLRSACDYSDKG